MARFGAGIFYYINISRLVNWKACVFDSAAAQTSATLRGVELACAESKTHAFPERVYV